MARTPSMSVADCEQALGQPSGMNRLAVDASNRGLVQKWLSAQGVRSTVAKSLSMDKLSLAYNDRAALADLVNASRTLPPDEATESSESNTPESDPMSAMPAEASARAPAPVPATAATQPAPVDTDSAAALLRLLRGNLDEARVISLIQQHAPKPENPVYKIELIRKESSYELPAAIRHEVFPDVLRFVEAGINVSLVGPAGSGKTTLAEQVAEALKIPFYFTGAIASEYKLTGFIDAQGRIINTAFRRAYEHGGLFLFDEMDGSMPQPVLAFNAALANGHADFPDGMVKRHPDFRAMGASNTFWTGADRVYVGRNQLDGATLDRFAFIEMGYDEALEKHMALATGYDGAEQWLAAVRRVRKAVAELKLRHIVSPRASVAGCKAMALGISREMALSACVFKGMDADAVSKVRAAAKV